MPIETHCANPACRKRFLVPEATAGKSVRCKSCGETFVAAASETAAGSTHRPAKSAAVAAGGIGPALGRFVVRHELGSGAFGTVYRAFDPILDRDVALKVPNPGVMADGRKIERFLREAKAAAGLRHPHIVAVFDAGKDGDRYYIASAFIEGKPLADGIPEGGTDFPRAARLVRELAEALAYAHDQGIVHRDIKPQNILLDAQDRALLTDFGIAARLDDSRITQDGARMGTAAYMAPEQAAGQKGEARPASDQYSAGVVLYELLTGQTPFSGPANIQIYNAIHTAPPPPRSLRPDVPRDLETICLKAMAKRSEDRYADCQELADDLRRWLEGEPIAARRMGLGERFVRWVRKEPKLAGTTLALAVVLVASVVLVSFAAAEADAARRQAEKEAARAEREAADARASGRVAEEQLKARQAAEKMASQLGVEKLGAVGTAADERRKALFQLTRADNAERSAAVANAELAGAKRRLTGSEYGRVVQLAYQAIKDGNREDANAQLQAAQADQRGWEWRYLQELCDTPPFSVPTVVELWGNTRKRAAALGAVAGCAAVAKSRWNGGPGLTGAAVSPDGSRVVAVGLDGAAQVWDGTTGKELATLTGPGGGMNAACFSPNGKWVVTAGRDGIARVWDSATGVELGSAGKPGPALQVALLTSDGKFVVTGNRDYPPALWELSTNKEPVTIKQHRYGVNSAAINPDGNLVVTAAPDGLLRVWIPTKRLAVPISLITPDGMKLLALFKPVFSPDGTRVAAACADDCARIWDAISGKELLVFKGHASDLRSVAFNGDGSLLVTGSRDGTARVWDTAIARELAVLKGHTGTVHSAAFSSDGNQVITASEDTTARIWDVKTGKELAKLPGHTKPVYTATFSRDGTRVLTSSHDGTARIWRFGAPVLEASAVAGSWLAVSPDGKRVLTAGGEAGVRVWDAVTGVELLAIRLPSPVNSVAWDADGNVIAGHPDGTARVLAADPAGAARR